MLLCIVGLIIGAIYDLVTTAKDKDQRIQESELKGQLAQFFLSIREPDGSTLLEKPEEFSNVSRPLSVVSLRHSFFTYLLHTGNAKTFKVGDVKWESSRACQVEFIGTARFGLPPPALQACFAIIPDDPSGRYIYFSLRYPTSKIQQHRAGGSIKNASHLVLTFIGQKETKLNLVFQAPPLARLRYPSQISRFEGLHELVGFVKDDGGRPSRYVSGQAFERKLEGGANATQNFITMVGRIDAAMLQPSVTSASDWPAPFLKGQKIGVQVYDNEVPFGPMRTTFDIPPGSTGTPLVSLTKAYLTAVPSRARLEVTASDANKVKRILWRSESAEISHPSRMQGVWQSIADWWTEKVIAAPGANGTPVSSSQSLYVAGLSDVVATLNAEPLTLPDIGTRAFAWLSIILLILLWLALDWAIYIYRLLRLRGTAYAMAVRPSSGGDLSLYAAMKNEIGTLSRVFHLLIVKNRMRNANTVRRNRLETSRQAESFRLAEAHVQNRKAILDAIGHEIRSPLQSLLIRTRENPEVQKDLARVQRAVEALHNATSVEDGLRNGEIIIDRQDLARFLLRFSSNLAEDGKQVTYIGPEAGVDADIDSIQLEQILDNLIDNAARHRHPGTDIELRLNNAPDGITLAVFNQGANIPNDDLERIFDLGVSDSETPGSGGLGLFASRIYGLAMRLTLHAQNEPNGVSLILTFPRGNYQME